MAKGTGGSGRGGGGVGKYGEGGGVPSERQVSYARALIAEAPNSWSEIIGPRASDYDTATVILEQAGLPSRPVFASRAGGRSRAEQWTTLIADARRLDSQARRWVSRVNVSSMSRAGISQFIDRMRIGHVAAYVARK